MGEVNRIELQVQGSYTVTLEGLASAGYRWSVTVDNPQRVRVERVSALQGVENARFGHSRNEKFELTGLTPGETIVHFSQARSFEAEKPPRATYDIEVRVSSAS